MPVFCISASLNGSPTPVSRNLAAPPMARAPRIAMRRPASAHNRPHQAYSARPHRSNRPRPASAGWLQGISTAFNGGLVFDCPGRFRRKLPQILPSRSERNGGVAVPFGWALSLQPSPPDHRSWVRAMSPTGVRGHACSAAPVASYAGAPSRGETLRAMSSRVAKVFRS